MIAFVVWFLSIFGVFAGWILSGVLAERLERYAFHFGRPSGNDITIALFLGPVWLVGMAPIAFCEWLDRRSAPNDRALLYGERDRCSAESRRERVMRDNDEYVKIFPSKDGWLKVEIKGGGGGGGFVSDEAGYGGYPLGSRPDPDAPKYLDEVPVEPSDEMLAAAVEAGVDAETARKAWAAMIAECDYWPSAEGEE